MPEILSLDKDMAHRGAYVCARGVRESPD
jgi:hypothetical protein